MLFNKLTIMQNVGNITSDGIIKFGGDAYITSATMLGNGIFELQGDLNGNSLSINKPKSFNITGRTPQVISCSGAIFDNLNIDNPCKNGVNFTSQVYYCGTLNTHNSNITGTITQKQEER